MEELDSTSGLPLKKQDAVVDEEVVWLYKRKTPYKATIVGVHSSGTGRCEEKKDKSVKKRPPTMIMDDDTEKDLEEIVNTDSDSEGLNLEVSRPKRHKVSTPNEEDGDSEKARSYKQALNSWLSAIQQQAQQYYCSLTKTLYNHVNQWKCRDKGNTFPVQPKSQPAS